MAARTASRLVCSGGRTVRVALAPGACAQLVQAIDPAQARRALDDQEREAVEGLLLVGVGIGVGLVGSLVLTSWTRSLLFEVGPGDPVTIGAVSLLLTGTALLACYIPARRATRVDPMLALRCD